MKASMISLPLVALVAATVPARSQTAPASQVPAQSEYKLAAAIDLPGDKGGHCQCRLHPPQIGRLKIPQFGAVAHL